ncbi:beta-1,6-N-acetylglucosaminyltransferase enzyme [Micractinium conductrix]|uniref:Beta-1,6-N-acetylglucosaminyltransferase enzyme n=1 Tax=Micractinium conductrix TaxID=554055 RepID=A0A2P6UZC1_9CHLO|nr:beta-1,6-N-acetylglucosaminyltransferase enzyme [Micractinium conductrix]|eukprot:PSC67183.1 beta-1,6-N-acetylglucosaminyltransferase enzyme [Micractinium conductrix]
MQPPPLQPARGGGPLLPRTSSHTALNRQPKHQAPEGVQRQRPMRHTLLLLLTLVLAANLVWAAQGVAAWRRGRAGGGEGEQLLLQRLNSTTLSVEVSRVDGDSGDEQRSTYLLNAQLVDNNNASEEAAQQEGTRGVGGVGGAAAPAAADPAAPPGLVSQLKDMGTALSQALTAAKDGALGVPKVALLFLTRAAGQLPADAVHASLCRGDVAASPAGESAPGLWLLGGEEAAEEEDPEDAEQRRRDARERGVLPPGPTKVAAACGWNATSGEAIPMGSGSGAGGVIAQQHLFSVYVHAPPGLTDDELPELFRGHLITDRLQPEWGTHQLVEATRNLLWDAFKDPLNQRFVLVSESDIPLYDPFTLHQQLMSEGKSRVNACRHAAPTDTRRWTWRMSGGSLKAWHWRKSSQWFGLIRRHVEVVLKDVEVFRRFEEHCKDGWDGDYRRHRDCFSDEHYIPTLLATHSLDQESSCHIDGVVAVDWSAGGPHPKSYKSWEVRPSLVHKARGEDKGCNASDAVAGTWKRA